VSLTIISMCYEPYVVSQLTAASSASRKRSRPPLNLANGQKLTMCDIVWISPQSHSSLSVKPHFLWHALQWHKKWGFTDNELCDCGV